MSIVVALPPDDRAAAALGLGATLAASTGESLLVCTVVPTRWPAGPARVDAEYQAYLDGIAVRTLDRARADLGPDVRAEYLTWRSRSTPSGLLDVARQRGADLIVLGPGSEGSDVAGRDGPAGPARVTVGSVAEWLLHSSPIALALAPHGYRPSRGGVVRRVTAAFGASGGADHLVVAAASIAARTGAAVRIASFAVRPRTMLTAGVGPRVEEAVLREWVRTVEEAQRGAVSLLPEQPVDTVVGSGDTWAQALDAVPWTDGDLLVVGSSAVGPLATVFLGSRASKIVRHAPVPVVVVPRGARP